MRRVGRVRRWLAILGVLVAGSLWAAYGVTEDHGMRWTGVQRGDLVLGVDVDGNLRSTETSLLGPPQSRDVWEFKIANMHPEGEEVTAGTPVLAFDDQELRNRLNRQKAEAAEARKQIEKLEINLELMRRRDEMQMAEADAALRRAQLVADLEREARKKVKKKR